MEFVLMAIVPAFVLVGSICGLLAIMKIKDLQKRLRVLERAIHKPAPGQVQTASPQIDRAPSAPEQEVMPEDVATSQPEENQWSASVVQEETRPAEQAGIDWHALFQQYWMVLLGGVCLVFSGIFLVRYSIEHGLLGPTARFVLGLLFGGSLIAGGEWLRRSDRLAAGVHAVLTASGLLVLYSVILVGLHVYELVPARAAFAALALVSAFSMLLALKHGPVTAGMGLLGAYLVPILVSTGSKNIEAALLYTWIVTAGSLWLQRYIYRPWLWWGTWVGALAWFLISLDMPDRAQGVRQLYIAALAYAAVALPFAGLKLSRIEIGDYPSRQIVEQLTAVYAALTLAEIISLRIEYLSVLSYPSITLLPIIAMLVVRENLPLLARLPLICLLPFVVDLVSLDIEILDWNISISPMPENLQSPYVTMLLIMTTASLAIAGNEFIKNRNRAYWSVIALFVPLAGILLAYIRITGFAGGLDWGVPTVSLGILYGYLLETWRRRQGEKEVEAALAIASQVAVGLACFMVFSGVTLTLVLSLQLVGLSYTYRKLRIDILPLIMKCLLMVVIVRLTANPWVFVYDVGSEIILLTYAGSLAACLVSSSIVQNGGVLRVWLHSASAHLLVLTLAVFTRYLVYDGDIFIRSFNLTEASVYVCSWAAIGLVYLWKAGYLEHHRAWYRGIGLLHIVASGTIYVFYNLLVHNPLWRTESIGDTPVLNLLLTGYGLPVILATAVYRRAELLRRWAGVVALVGLYMFLTLEIRHLWNGGIHPGMPVLEGELYTYSLIYLLVSICLLVYGAYRKNAGVQQAGMIALVLVVAKVFLWDMRDLDGLWRVVSFLGLGLSLLGVAYLFSRLKTMDVNSVTR